MRIPVRILGFVIAFLLVSASPAQAQDRCAFKGAKTLQQTSKLRLYRISATNEDQLDRFYVCVRANGRRFRADDRRATDVTMLKATLTSAGSFAAYAYTYYRNEDVAGLRVVVLNLKTGKQRIHLENPDEFSLPRVPSLVLRSTGGAAWIFEQKPISTSEGQRKREVHTARTGSIRTLDTGLDIDAASLRLEGSTVSWIKAGMRKTAPLA